MSRYVSCRKHRDIIWSWGACSRVFAYIFLVGSNSDFGLNCVDGLYTYAVDMWSVGCILAEIMARRPIFPGAFCFLLYPTAAYIMDYSLCEFVNDFTGKNFIDQLTLIFDVIGSPQPDEVAHIQNSQAKKYLSSQKGKRAVRKKGYATDMNDYCDD